MAKLKTAKGSVRANAGFPAKAGRRRPPHIQKDANGDYQTVNVPVKQFPKVKPDFGIAKKFQSDIYDETESRIHQRNYNLAVLNRQDSKGLIQKAKEALMKMAKTTHKSDPFWFANRLNDFKRGWISVDEIMKGRV